MENYLVLIRKSDFIDLFKYGSLYINENNVRHFTCSVDSLKDKKSIFDDLIRFSNEFESTFSYLILHYTKQHDSAKLLRISDVKHIYPLDYEAMREFKSSFDSRIRIEEPLWPECVYELQKKRALKDCLKGVDNIWSICNIENSLKDTISEKYISNLIIEEIVSELYENRRPSGNLPFWVYIMRYERHSFYPTNNYGYFMDAVHAILNYNAQRELFSEDIEKTHIIRCLKKLNENSDKDKLTFILDMLETEKDVEKFLTYLSGLDATMDLLKCIVLFFMFRDRYREEFKYEPKWIERAKKEEEFPIVMYMLGVMLQHEHTYDSYYEAISLSIFKKYKPSLEILTSSIVDCLESNFTINPDIIKYSWDVVPNEERKVKWSSDSMNVRFNDENSLYPIIYFNIPGRYKIYVELDVKTSEDCNSKGALEINVKFPSKKKQITFESEDTKLNNGLITAMSSKKSVKEKETKTTKKSKKNVSLRQNEIEFK